MKIGQWGIIAGMLLLAACGKPDASGIYVASNDRQVTLIQLVQAPDGKLTGRLVESTINANGKIDTKEASVDGSASGHELLLRPASVWFGGIQASGTFTGSALSLTGKGFTMNANLTSLEKYREAVAKLGDNAVAQQKKVAETNAATADYKARFDAANDLANLKRQLGKIAVRLHQGAGRLNEAVSNSPNFGEQAASNTARVAELVKLANGQSDLARNQLGVKANQIEVNTNQIEVARSQYAIQLGNLVADAQDDVSSISRICSTTPPAGLDTECRAAIGALNEFKSTMRSGVKTFSPYKQQLQQEMKRQEELGRQIKN